MGGLKKRIKKDGLENEELLDFQVNWMKDFSLKDSSSSFSFSDI